MLRIATKSVCACTVSIDIPKHIAETYNHQTYGFYSFVGDSNSEEVYDLGAPPVDGKMDSLGNRPVIHTNVNGDVAYGTDLELAGVKAGQYRAFLGVLIPEYLRKWKYTGVDYCAKRPMNVQGEVTIPTFHNSAYGPCSLSCSITGDTEQVRVDVKFTPGPYTDPKTGRVRHTEVGHASVVLTNPHNQYHTASKDERVRCGLITSAFISEMIIHVKCIFPGVPHTYDVSYANSLIAGLQPQISAVKLAHTLLALSRITTGDTKAMLDAFQSIRYASFNGLAFTHDTSKLIRDTSRLIRDIKKVRKDPKRLASIWLSYRYGHRLYYKDCQALWNTARSIKRRRPVKFRGRHIEELHLFQGTVTRVEYNFTLYASPTCYTDLSLVAGIRALDFWPSAENLWDLVPFSFAADWFVNITDLCKRHDALKDMDKFPILGALQSVKISTESVSRSSSASGRANTTLYMRVPLTPASLSTTLASMNLSFLDGVSFLHMADAFALAISRKRR